MSVHEVRLTEAINRMTPSEFEECSFMRPQRGSVSLVRDKERLSAFYDHETKLPLEDLVDYNEAKVAEVARNVFEDPPIMQAYLSVDLGAVEPYVGAGGARELVLARMAQWQRVDRVLPRLYQAIQLKTQKLSEVMCYLNDELGESMRTQRGLAQQFEAIRKDLLKFTIMVDRELR